MCFGQLNVVTFKEKDLLFIFFGYINLFVFFARLWKIKEKDKRQQRTHGTREKNNTQKIDIQKKADSPIFKL